MLGFEFLGKYLYFIFIYVRYWDDDDVGDVMTMLVFF